MCISDSKPFWFTSYDDDDDDDDEKDIGFIIRI